MMGIALVMGRILGIDYGERRIGVAISDATRTIATPLAVIQYVRIEEACRDIARRLEETGAEKIVVGMPISLGGFRGASAHHVESFTEKLKGVVTVPVETWDERFTTTTAEKALIEGGTRRNRRKQVIDKLAAQIMLQHYLDAQAGS